MHEGSERKSKKVTVPDFIGLTAHEANVLAASAGLNIKILGVDDRKTNNKLKVVKQSLICGDSVEEGTVIELTVLKLDFED